MAKNWTLSDGYEVLKERSDCESIVDLGKRFPLASNAISAGDIGAIMQAIPETITMRKLEGALNTLGDEETEVEEVKTVKKGRGRPPAKTKKVEVDEEDYESMTGKELWNLCEEKGIPRKERGGKKADFIAALRLVDADGEVEDDDDEVDFEELEEKPKRGRGRPPASAKTKATKVEVEDEWEDDEEEKDYSEMSAIELYKLCEEKGIDCVARKPQKYYISLLEKDDEDDDEDEWKI